MDMLRMRRSGSLPADPGAARWAARARARQEVRVPGVLARVAGFFRKAVPQEVGRHDLAPRLSTRKSSTGADRSYRRLADWELSARLGSYVVREGAARETGQFYQEHRLHALSGRALRRAQGDTAQRVRTALRGPALATWGLRGHTITLFERQLRAMKRAEGVE